MIQSNRFLVAENRSFLFFKIRLLSVKSLWEQKNNQSGLTMKERSPQLKRKAQEKSRLHPLGDPLALDEPQNAMGSMVRESPATLLTLWTIILGPHSPTSILLLDSRQEP